jgi:dUTP pyrophosphatase
MEVKVKGNIPVYGKPGDAGADLVSERDVVLGSGQTILVPTGTFIEIPEGYVGLVHPRSGLAANHGITVLNAPGTIDSGFRGEIQVILHNSGGHAVPISKGMRIAQLVIQEFVTAKFVQVDELSDTERGDGGFGSTGK